MQARKSKFQRYESQKNFVEDSDSFGLVLQNK